MTRPTKRNPSPAARPAAPGGPKVDIAVSTAALPAALTRAQASEYLGLESGSRWLDDAPIPWVDLRKPGATRPIKRWRRVDLDAFLAGRLVKPGFPSPFE